MSDWVSLKNTLDISLRPIDVWPGKLKQERTFSPFSAPFKDTLTKLKRELSALSAKNIVLQIAIREGDLRLDGLPRAGAIAMHPGVILAFGSKHGPLRLIFDGFSKWPDNLRAIVMHLENLRHASLYGVGTDGQQYKGWQALTAPEPDHFSSPEAAAQFIIAAAKLVHLKQQDLLTDFKVMDQSYRQAAKLAHPDTGGDHEQFVRLQQAKDLLDKHHRR